MAQKIALELFETDVLRVANRSPAWDYLLEGDARATRGYPLTELSGPPKTAGIFKIA